MAEPQSHNLKEIAARYAVKHTILPGMNIGLGTGSTAAFAVVALAERVRSEGLVIGRLIATSVETAELADAHGLHAERDPGALSGLLDVTIDGADEVDANFNVIKGGGGALLREKLVAVQTMREVIIVDESKVSLRLGEKHSLPVMVAPYAWESTAARVSAVTNAPAHLRMSPTGARFISDDGLYCLDVPTGPIDDPAALESRLKLLTGVADVGLFVGIAQTIVIACADGRMDVRERG